MMAVESCIDESQRIILNNLLEREKQERFASGNIFKNTLLLTDKLKFIHFYRLIYESGLA